VFLCAWGLLDIINRELSFLNKGLLGVYREFHCWVMTIDSNLEVITFWETMKNEKYELRGRIKREQKEHLKTFLYNTDKENTEENFFSKKFKDFSNFVHLFLKKKFFSENFGLDNLKNLSPTKKSNKSSNPKDTTSKKNNEITEHDEENEDQEIEEDAQAKLDYKDELIEIIEDPLMDICDLPNFFQKQSKRKHAKYGGFSKDNKKEKKEINNEKPNFLEGRKKEIVEEESKKKDLIKLQPIILFSDVDGQRIKGVEIPYKSIEVI